MAGLKIGFLGNKKATNLGDLSRKRKEEERETKREEKKEIRKD